MNEVVKLKDIPDPVSHKGRERFIAGWNTAAVAKWLINKKVERRFVTLSQVAFCAYARDSASNRQAVKRNVASLRRHMASHNEFLLVRYGYQHRIEAIKVCNLAFEDDRRIALEQLTILETKGEVTLMEAERWREMLYLPPELPAAALVE